MFVLAREMWARISALLLDSASSNPLALFILLLVSSLGLACVIAFLLDVHDKRRHSVTDTRKFSSDGRRDGKKRIYVDGVFDLVHVGHAHALFQAARCFPDCEILVGVNADDDVFAAKGSRPVMTQAERADVLREIKWVDDVMEKTPYSLTMDFIASLLRNENVGYVVHGSDIAVGADGRDAYQAAREMGIFRVVPRTEGISTTQIIDKLIAMSIRSDKKVKTKSFASWKRRRQKSHNGNDHDENGDQETSTASERENIDVSASTSSTQIDSVLFSTLVDMYTYHRRDACVASGRHASLNRKAVYLESRFDMITPSIISRLHVARARARAIDTSCSVVCGVVDAHDDARDAKRQAGKGHQQQQRLSMLGTLERVMMLLSMRSVDDVVIVHGNTSDTYVGPYTIVDRIDVHESASIADLALRVGQNRENYRLRNQKKNKAAHSPHFRS